MYLCDVCLTGRRLTRKRGRETTVNVSSLSGSTEDMLCQSAGIESSAALRRGLSLRSGPRHTRAVVVRPGHDSQTLTENSPSDDTVLQRAVGIGSWAAKSFNRDGAQSSRDRVSRDEDSLVPGAQLFNTHTASVVQLDRSDGVVVSRRRLGMTGRASRQTGATKDHCHGVNDVSVSVCRLKNGGDCNRPDPSDGRMALSPVSRSTSELDKSFTKLVTGLRQVPRRHQVGNESAAETARLTPQGLRPRSLQTRSHTHGRSSRLDHNQHCDQKDGRFVPVDRGDDQSMMKGCVVVLERSRSIDEMVDSTTSHPVVEPSIFSPTVSSTQSLRAASLAAASSVLAADQSDQVHRRLSLRKSPRTDVTSSSPTRDRSFETAVRLSERSRSGGTPTETRPGRLKRRKVRLQLMGSHDVKDSAIQDHDRPTERADVGQVQVTLPQPDPDVVAVARGKYAKYAGGSEAEVWLRPDPDFLPLQPSVKRAKTVAVELESDVGRSEVTLQRDPDSLDTGEGVDVDRSKVILQPDLNLLSSSSLSIQPGIVPQPDPYPLSSSRVMCAGTVNRRTFVGRLEVTLQSDPDRSQPDPNSAWPTSDAADFSRDQCMDAMYHMAMVSSPEASDLDSSPPNPLSPTDGEAGTCLPDLNLTSTAADELEVNLDDRSMADIMRRASDVSIDMFSYNDSITDIVPGRSKSRVKDLDQERPSIALETMVSDVAESLNWSEDIESSLMPLSEKSSRTAKHGDDCSRQLQNITRDDGKIEIGSTPLSVESVVNCDVEKGLSQFKNMRFSFVGYNDVGSTPSARLSLVESTTTLTNFNGKSRSFSEKVEVNLVDEAVTVDSRSNEGNRRTSLDDTVVVEVDSPSVRVVMCPEGLPPSRHQVMSDLMTSGRRTLLQSTYDAFYSDDGDSLPRSRYVLPMTTVCLK